MCVCVCVEGVEWEKNLVYKINAQVCVLKHILHS